MSLLARRLWQPSPALAIEILLVALLVAVLLAQLLSYPATADPDPDGYVSYARWIRRHGTLTSSGRLPGYPIFLAVIERQFRGPLAELVYWTQLWKTVVFCLVLWIWVRRRFGVLTALCLLGIYAAPCYFMQMSVVMLPDGPYSLLVVPFLLGMGWWVLAVNPRGGWLWLPVFAAATQALHAVRPTTFLIVLAFLTSLLVGWLVRRRLAIDGERLTRPSTAVTRVGALLVVAVVVAAISDLFLDTGARRQNTEILAYRVVTRLPPASDSEAEQRIEQAKAQFRQVEGQRIEDMRFGAYRQSGFNAGIAPDDALAVWRDRLAAHPGLYILVVVEELRRDHHMVGRLFVPYFLDTTRYSLFDTRYPPNDGSPQGDLFRWTGLFTLDRLPHPAHYPLIVDTVVAVAQLVAAWGPLAIGVWRAWPRDGAMVIGLAGGCGIFTLAVAATNTIDGRYLLPFAPLIYLGQAIGIAWIVRSLVHAGVTKPSAGFPRSSLPTCHRGHRAGARPSDVSRRTETAGPPRTPTAPRREIMEGEQA